VRILKPSLIVALLAASAIGAAACAGRSRAPTTVTPDEWSRYGADVYTAGPASATVLSPAAGLALAAPTEEESHEQAPPVRPGSGGVTLELVWKAALGSGYSRFAVASGLAVTMFSDGEFDHAVALDVATGEEIWRYRIAATYRGHDGSRDGPISTPVIEAGVVYGLGPAGHLFALTLADGRLIWSTEITQGEGARPPVWGFATTPLIAGDVLIVQTGGGDGRSVTGFRKQTGQVLWAVGNDTVGYQSPAIGTLMGQQQVVAVGNHEMMGIRPDTGELLWSHTIGELYAEGSEQAVFPGNDHLLVQFYGDGPGRRGSDAVLYQVRKNEDGWAVDEIWRTTALRRSWAAPVVHAGQVYGFDGSFLTCVDLATGRLLWKSRPPGNGGLSLVDGRLVTFSYQGVVTVIDATPVGYREIASQPVADHGSYQAPTVAEGRIFVRNFTEVASLRVIASGAGATRGTDAAASPLLQGAFGTFVRRVEAAPADEKAGLIDAFLATQQEFPILEGDSTVHFVYRADVDDIALYGSMADAESGAPMVRIPGTDFHYASYAAEPNTRWEYWFLLDFDRVVPDPRNPRRTRARGWRNNSGAPMDVSEVALPKWIPPPYLEAPSERRGRIERFVFSIPTDLANAFATRRASLVAEREVRVYLPPGYDSGSARYPLLIVNDGIDALEQGRMDQALDYLVGRTVAPVIVAFVEGPRSELAGTRRLTDAYVQLVVDALVPLLDRTYRTVAGSQARAMMGAGQGGVAAVYAALHYPQVFGKVAVQSPGLFWNPGSELLSAVRDQDPIPVEFYVDWNRYDLRVRNSAGANFDLREDTRAFAALLKAKGYAVTGGEAAEGFGWTSWRATTDQLLEALFPLNAQRGRAQPQRGSSRSGSRPTSPSAGS